LVILEVAEESEISPFTSSFAPGLVVPETLLEGSGKGAEGEMLL